MRRFTILGIFLIILFCFGLQLFAVDKITILSPMVSTGSSQEKTLLDDVLTEAAAMASRLYKDYLTVTYKKVQSDNSAKCTISTVANFEGENTVIVLTLNQKGGGEAPNFTLYGELTIQSARYFASSVFYVWSATQSYLTSKMKDAPAFVDKLLLDPYAQSVHPNMPNIQLYPYDITMKNGENVLVACTNSCIELDRNFRLVDKIGKALMDKGNYSFASMVEVTPGGTIYLKPATGKEVYRFLEGVERPQTWRIGTNAYGPFAVFPDGSMLIVDTTNKKSYRQLKTKISEFNIFTSPTSWVNAVTIGPEGNLWTFDITERRMKIFTMEGELVDSIIPISEQYMQPFAIAVYPDGSFILATYTDVWCFKRNGIPLWKVNEIPGPVPESLPQMAYFTFDSKNGFIYISDITSRQIYKLMDVGYCKEKGITNTIEEKLISLNKRISRDPEDPALYFEKAKIYESVNAAEMAKLQYEAILEIDPFHDEASRKLDTVEVEILKKNAEELREKTMDILEKYGTESARMSYSQTVQLYERILNINPNDQEVKKDLEDLKSKFTKREQVTITKKKVIEITEAKVDNIYPSLMQYYRKNPVGTVVVKNTLKETINNLRASIYIRKYMDFPTETEVVKELKAGKSATLNLYVNLNSEIFEIQEDLPKQAAIEVIYATQGEEYSTSKNVSLTIYRRTALSWDDSGKISSFIMPNEEIISNFSHRVSEIGMVGKKYDISKKFFRAIRICDALGEYGINYIEDPDSPLSSVIGKSEAVDTVRFPRRTLLLRSGDCDDSTALLGSLFESAGIRTAVMTSPGHVFLAFDTEEPEENDWQFKSDKLEVIDYNGTIWIPVETTIISQGFYKAWETSSKTVKTYKGKKELEFLPIFELREKYPALPLPETAFTVVEPPATDVERVFTTSVNNVVNKLYKNSLSQLEAKMKSARGRTAMKLNSQIGILHARFGNYREAEKIFNQAIKDNPTFVASYINLANIKLGQDDEKGAIDILEKGIVKNPNSILMNLLLARCYYAQGDMSKVSKYYKVVKSKSPSVAERYAYLEDTSSTARAASAEEDMLLIWDTGE